MDREYIISTFCDCVSLIDKDRIETASEVLYYSISKPFDDITSTYLDVFLFGLLPSNTGNQKLDDMSDTFFLSLTEKQVSIILNSLKTLFSTSNRLDDDLSREVLLYWEKLSKVRQ